MLFLNKLTLLILFDNTLTGTDLLLLNFSKNKDVKKNKMVEFFEALGNNNEKTIYYRKKLSSIIFS